MMSLSIGTPGKGGEYGTEAVAAGIGVEVVPSMMDSYEMGPSVAVHVRWLVRWSGLQDKPMLMEVAGSGCRGRI